MWGAELGGNENTFCSNGNWFRARATPQGTVKHLKRNKEIQSVSQLLGGNSGAENKKYKNKLYLNKLNENK